MSESFLLDVFREPHNEVTWTYRRHAAITVPQAAAYEHTADGVPYLVPELTLLFKSRPLQLKDQDDFDAALPALDDQRRDRLRGWLELTELSHPWLAAL